LQVLKKSAILGVVEGGYNIEGRAKSAKYLSNSPVFGYVIDGLHKNGPDVEKLTFGDVKPILEECLVT
jgi:queuine tRNA-ribosyltransferase subunit QTRTD1